MSVGQRLHDRDVQIPAGSVLLPGLLRLPQDAPGIVIFAHGSGSSRLSPRNQTVADTIAQRGLATLLFDLLSGPESQDRANVFDIRLLARRLAAAADWVRSQPELADLRIGYFGASTGAAAALVAAADDPHIAAIVSRGGRPDLAGDALVCVRAPTLLIVGELDTPVLAMNRTAQHQLCCDSRLVVIPGASHLFEEPGCLEQVARLAAGWFDLHLTAPR